MKLTGLDVFDSTVQRTNAWLKELMQELNWSDHRRTYLAFRSVMHALRDNLSVDEAVELGEELPLLVRGFYYDHWKPAATPALVRNKSDFLSLLAASMSRDGGDRDESVNPELVARAVFRFLDRKANEGEIRDLHRLIPPALLDLWPPTLRAA